MSEVSSRRQVITAFIVGKTIIVAIFILARLCITPYNESVKIALGDSLLRPFFSWDGLYFLEIAQHGYRFEKHWAFLPLYPYAASAIGRLLAVFNLSASLAMAFALVLVSNLSHFVATLVLFELTRRLFDDEFARISATVFALNQASVQLTAAYSEGLCALLVFTGCLCYYKYQFILASLLFGLAGMTRSNAVIVGGCLFLHKLFSRPRHDLAKTLVCLIVSGSGFFAYLLAAYLRYCRGPGAQPEWCKSAIPNIYSFVQAHYWDVGLFNYYTIDQLPNFVIAAPMISLTLSGIVSFVKSRRSLSKSRIRFNSPFLTPHIVGWSITLAYIALFAHVQVITRLFSGLPVVYWHMAHLIRSGYVSVIYITGCYALVNAILFASYYPPA